MTPDKILGDYARYYNPLQKMGGFPLSDSPTIEDLEVSKAQLQSGYKDIRESDFEGSFTDFLCLVSLRFLVFTCGSVEGIIESQGKYRADISNSLRLIMKKPDIIFNELGIKPDKKLFTELAGLYWEFYHKKP